MNITTRAVSADVTSGALVADIKSREVSIFKSKLELARKWIEQGMDLQELQSCMECSQNALAEITGLSTGSISNCINISKDERIKDLVDAVHSNEHLVGGINQSSLVKLAKLNDEDFDEYVTTGVFSTTSVNDVADEIIDVDVEDSIEEQISQKRVQIEQLQAEIVELEKQLPITPTTTTSTQSTARAVIQIFDDGTTKEYPSASSAAKATDATATNITKVCKGKRKIAGGSKSSYINENSPIIKENLNKEQS